MFLGCDLHSHVVYGICTCDSGTEHLALCNERILEFEKMTINV